MGTVRELTLTCADGQTYNIDDAKEITPGLLVYRIPDGMHPRSLQRWRIGHHSGLSIADSMRREDAITGAELLSTLANWTQDASALREQLNPVDLFIKLSRVHCVEPCTDLLPPGADASNNGRYTEDDIHRAATEYANDGYNALEILLDMSDRGPWMGLDTEAFNEAHSRIATLAKAA